MVCSSMPSDPSPEVWTEPVEVEMRSPRRCRCRHVADEVAVDIAAGPANRLGDNAGRESSPWVMTLPVWL